MAGRGGHGPLRTLAMKAETGVWSVSATVAPTAPTRILFFGSMVFPCGYTADVASIMPGGCPLPPSA